LLSLNYNKTQFIYFVSKSNLDLNLGINFENNYIVGTQNTTFLGLVIDNTLSWKTHIDSLLPKLSSACYAIRSLKSFMSLENLRMVCFSYVHSLISYGIIFWGNSPYSKSIKKKKVVRIVMNAGIRDSCRDMFKELKHFSASFSVYLFRTIICS
jgi:hypothetical protein